jgi:hypothetical protein
MVEDNGFEKSYIKNILNCSDEILESLNYNFYEKSQIVNIFKHIPRKFANRLVAFGY